MGAFNQLNPKQKQDYETGCWPGIGLLSQSAEKDMGGMSLMEEYKTPHDANGNVLKRPVYVVHSGDHFTTMWFQDDVPDYKETESTFKAVLWNGLPPYGPRGCVMEILAHQGPAKPPGDSHEQTEYRAIVGQIDSVVQARAEDKKDRPKQWNTWTYEVVLATQSLVEQDTKTPERPEDAPKPAVFSLGEPPVSGEPWRCIECYNTRYKTMCFGQNPGSAETCETCKRSKKEASWSLWMPYSELPGGWKAHCTRQHAPKIFALLANKWPGCDVEFVGDGEEAPSI